ncbi:hypothetical protein L1987_14035 [Smallanthus sonchifolius]|uniref:Uncharacterized protein n=1 Tax=Smallanthus sonchifolius TaxID=185202 RepID=A0ACB9JIL2_9ASTR|nr:hypothetical protein L1987_14035 [Smallanthus sonchifolius]
MYSNDVKQHLYNNIDNNIQDMLLGNFNALELQQLARIKNELSVTDQDFMSENNDQLIRYNNVNNQDMFFNSFDTNSCYRGTFSQILPTLRISNSNDQPSNTFDMNLPALDPFGYPRFNGSFNYQPSFNAHNIGHLLKDNCLSYGVDQMNRKIAQAFVVETTEAKRRASNDMDSKAPKANVTKKSKVDMRPSCTQLKVRKEKLGDRILALQQMVAPFGKTDTASVLMEAIGYIKFLQNQVETLSVPYMNSTQQASGISTRGGSTKDRKEETKKDLRSRGLCLVPISCLAYVTYGGGSVWATL